jgi:hypothetical protein
MKHAARAALLCLLLSCGDPTGPDSARLALESVTPGSIPSGSLPTTVILSGRGFVAESRVRFDGVERAATVIDGTEIRTELAATELAVSRTIVVSVINPGDELSNRITLRVTNPVPVLDAVVPADVLAGDSAQTFVVQGRAFRPNSTVLWNGVARPTRFISTQQLDVDVTKEDLAVAARVRLAVRNPGPEGGMAEIEFLVKNLKPRILSISPDSVYQDLPVTVVVTGENFVPGVGIRWNGATHVASYIGPDRLSFDLSAADRATVGAATLAVVNPEPAVAASDDTTFLVRPPTQRLVDLIAWDLAWDPTRALLYASVASNDLRFPNSIAAIDPVTGDVVSHLNVGFEPRQIAITDDASFLYVAIDGNSQVARVDLASFTRDLVFGLGEGEWGTFYVGDLAPLPGRPHSVAVARRNEEVRPHREGIAVFDDDIQRPLAIGRYDGGGNRIEFGTPTTLYGFNNEDTGFQVYRMQVSDSGLVVLDEREGLVDTRTGGIGDAFGADLRSGGGWICSSLGTVIDAATGLLAATTGIMSLCLPDEDGSRIYFFTHAKLYAVSTATWTLFGTKDMSALPQSWFGVTRWGPDGFAYVGPTQVVIFRSDLITRPLVP